MICFGEADIGWMWINQRNIEVGKTSQRKTRNPAEMEVERTLKSTGWLGRLCSMEVARWCFGNGWQDLLRVVLPWFFGLKIHFQAEQKPFRLHDFASLNHPSISVLSIPDFYILSMFLFRLDFPFFSSPLFHLFARPYESHEVTLSIDPAKLGVVAMAPFDGKAECSMPTDQDRVGMKEINRCSRNISWCSSVIEFM